MSPAHVVPALVNLRTLYLRTSHVRNDRGRGPNTEVLMCNSTRTSSEQHRGQDSDADSNHDNGNANDNDNGNRNSNCLVMKVSVSVMIVPTLMCTTRM